MSCLKMYNFSPKPRGLCVPDGFIVEKFKNESEIADWLHICRDGLIAPTDGEEKFRAELMELDGPDPYRDTYFITDLHTQKKIATFTVVPNMWSTGLGYIHMVAVRHEYRGCGLGRFIADYCLQLLWAAGKDKIFLLTNDTRLPAIATYLKAGFAPVQYIDEKGEGMISRWIKIMHSLGLPTLQLLDEKGVLCQTLVNKIVKVTDTPFGAAGDGIKNDRPAIQAAIDDAYHAGGGTVVLSAGKTFKSGNLILRDCVELRFEEGAVLLQSENPDDYVKPTDNGKTVACRPLYGYNLYPDIKWSHAWYFNYPLIYAGEGTHDVAIKGKGTVRMMSDADIEHLLRICPIGFYRVSQFEISDIEITDYHSYAMMPFYCDHGLIRDLTIHNWSQGNGDGICLMNDQHIRISCCHIDSGDDSLYIFSSYRDPRGNQIPTWWSSNEPQPSVDIEIDHNHLTSNHCKGFAMILWGIDCPDQELVEVRDVYVHDNYFQTLGVWLYNPYTAKKGHPPVTHVRFENNLIDAIEPNFFETQITDMSFFHSAKQFLNGRFEDGRVFWSMRGHSDAVGVASEPIEPSKDDPRTVNSYGYIRDFAHTDSALYQGLYIRAGEYCNFWAKIRTSEAGCRMFVRDLETGEIIAERDVSSPEWKDIQIDFKVPRDGNYHLGIERGNVKEGWAHIGNAVLLGNCDAAFGYKRVGTDPRDTWKPLYFYNPDLWKQD